MNQEELVKRLQIKDIMAFERLYHMYRKNVCGVIHTIVNDETLAVELSQDVFTRVWNDSHTYSPLKGPFFSWVLHIARKTALDALCSKTRETHQKNVSADSLLRILENRSEDEPKNDADGLKKLAKNVGRGHMEIFDLLYFKGYTQRETAEVLGIPLSKVIKRNRNGILKIRDNMAFEWI